MNRLAIDCRMYEKSGIGTYLKSLIPLLVKKMPKVEFHLIAGNDDYDNITKIGDNIKVLTCNSPIYSVAEQFKLLKNIQADFFWSPHYNIPILCRVPLLVTIHDCAHLAMPEIYGSSIMKRLYAKFMFNRIKTNASRIITVSEFSKQEIIKYTGICPEKISVVYNGVAPSWFDLSRDCSSRKLTSRQYIIFVGNVKPHKNLSKLFNAFERICDRIEHDLIVVGSMDGFITGDVDAQKTAEKTKDRVRFTGPVSDAELKSYVANADCMVFPSLYEGFGLPPLEAMAAGVPVCASDIPAVKEVCGSAVKYFSPLDVESIADTVEKLLNDDDAKKTLIEKGKKNAMQFSWANAAEKHIEITEQLIQGV